MPRSDGRVGGWGGWADGPWEIRVDSTGRSGEYNMEADVDLLERSERSGACYLRLYRWDPATLSIGRNQSIEQVTSDGIPVVRRPTGGQAVWHEHEVTYAVAGPIDLFGSLRQAYCAIHTRLSEALRSLGVQTQFAPAQRPIRRSTNTSCFASSVGGEILVNGRKLVGSAQVRRRTAFLQHGSILLAGAQGITLSEILKRPVSFEEVVAAIVSIWPSVPQSVHPSEVASLAAR